VIRALYTISALGLVFACGLAHDTVELDASVQSVRGPTHSQCGPQPKVKPVPCADKSEPRWVCGNVAGKWQWLQVCIEVLR
jgi:hypothetical protein